MGDDLLGFSPKTNPKAIAVGSKAHLRAARGWYLVDLVLSPHTEGLGIRAMLRTA